LKQAFYWGLVRGSERKKKKSRRKSTPIVTNASHKTMREYKKAGSGKTQKKGTVIRRKENRKEGMCRRPTTQDNELLGSLKHLGVKDSKATNC